MQRRSDERHAIWLAVELSQAEGETALAVSRDASRAGVLVLTGVPFAVGAAVRATLRLPPEGVEERTVAAVVVRCEPNLEDPDGLWHHRVALRFDAPDAAIEAWLAELKPPPSFR